MKWQTAFIGIGSNLGYREKNIRLSINLIQEKCNVLKISSIIETKPVGFLSQRKFLNCAIKVETAMKPLDLLSFLQQIEKKLGRVRTIKNGPRTIDLDILFYGDEVIISKNLIIPHPKVIERKFVLGPMNEIEPNFMHPRLRKTINELYKTLRLR